MSGLLLRILPLLLLLLQPLSVLLLLLLVLRKDRVHAKVPPSSVVDAPRGGQEAGLAGTHKTLTEPAHGGGRHGKKHVLVRHTTSSTAPHKPNQCAAPLYDGYLAPQVHP